MRNPNLVRTRGLYDSLITREESVIWPVRATRGVNRGYRDQFFRADDSSVTIQGAGTPVIFRGDRLPKELQGQAFITDSPTNLVHAYKIVDEGTGRLHAEDFKKGEIFASWGRAMPAVTASPRPRRHALCRRHVSRRRRTARSGTTFQTCRLHSRRARSGRAGQAGPRLANRPTTACVRTLRQLQSATFPNSGNLSHQTGGGAYGAAVAEIVGSAANKTVNPQLRAGRPGPTGVAAPQRWRLRWPSTLEAAQVERAALPDKSPEVRASAVRLSALARRSRSAARASARVKLMDDELDGAWQVAASISQLPQADARRARYRDARAVIWQRSDSLDATVSGRAVKPSSIGSFERAVGRRRRTPSRARRRDCEECRPGWRAATDRTGDGNVRNRMAARPLCAGAWTPAFPAQGGGRGRGTAGRDRAEVRPRGRRRAGCPSPRR